MPARLKGKAYMKPDCDAAAVDAAEAQAWDWAASFDLLPQFDFPGFQRAGYLKVIPNGYVVRKKTFPVIAHWTIWLYAYDDYYDEHVNWSGTQWQEESHPLTRALADLQERTLKHMSTAWRTRFTTHLDALFSASKAETALRHQCGDLESYLNLRSYTVGMLPVLDLAEYSLGRELPLAVTRLPAYQKALFNIANQVAWTNDLLDHKRDTRNNDPSNLVLILARATDDLSAAKCTTQTMITGQAEEYAAASTELLDRCRAQDIETVHACLDLYNQWPQAYLNWHEARTSRYTPS
ncbi:terpene synthase family protein [Streptomyces sp. NPDC057909]|uniref:terpene synthase family protein n=1 Tax=Streptomyces sp. NPDC057909 TaxID=3346277 RepID=UPI0036E59CCE